MARRKFGWKSGQIHALNIQSGSVDMNTDSGGDAEASVVFNNTFKTAPSVVLTAKEVDTTGTLSVTTADVSGFTTHLEGSSLTSDTLSVNWIAIDQTK